LIDRNDVSASLALAFKRLIRFSATISSPRLVTGAKLSFLFRKNIMLCWVRA